MSELILKIYFLIMAFKYEIIKSILLKIKEVEDRNNLIIISLIFENNNSIILVIENQNIINNTKIKHNMFINDITNRLEINNLCNQLINEISNKNRYINII